MTSIKGLCGNAAERRHREPGDGPEVPAHHHAGSRTGLTRLINDILTVSKLESGKDAAPNERIKLDEMADDVSEMLRILASEKQVAISCNHPQEHSVVMGNADRVEQMLINLIENAIKYNKQGGSVTVSPV